MTCLCHKINCGMRTAKFTIGMSFPVLQSVFVVGGCCGLNDTKMGPCSRSLFWWLFSAMRCLSHTLREPARRGERAGTATAIQAFRWTKLRQFHHVPSSLCFPDGVVWLHLKSPFGITFLHETCIYFQMTYFSTSKASCMLICLKCSLCWFSSWSDSAN